MVAKRSYRTQRSRYRLFYRGLSSTFPPGAFLVYAVDEIPNTFRQCAYLAEVFANHIRTVEASVFSLLEQIPEGSLDLILFSGVLYHLSDMLVGLYVLRRCSNPAARSGSRPMRWTTSNNPTRISDALRRHVVAAFRTLRTG
jgi:hypothetical protein